MMVPDLKDIQTHRTMLQRRAIALGCILSCTLAIIVALPVFATPVIETKSDDLVTEPQDTYFLPILGNSDETDRSMLREISDTHVFERDNLDWESTREVSSTPDSNNVWEIIRASKPMPTRMTKAVKKQKQQYIKDKLWVSKILQRAKPYLPTIIKQLQERNMPLDLAMIPAVESGFQAHVSSSGSASGLWQIVPITAKEIGLKKTAWYDPRVDLLESTRAALDYLTYLNAEFHGDWELTLAAYNAGPGRLKSAIKRAKKKSKSVDFWSLNLPPETHAYVPKITALISLIRETPKSPLDLPEITMEPTFKIVDIGKRISLDKAATLAGIDEATFRLFNGGLTHSVTPPRGPHRLLVPIEAFEQFEQKLTQTGSRNLFSLPKMHVVTNGDSLSTIAELYGIKTRTLKELNGLQGNKILIGQKLAVLDARNHAQNNETSSQDLLSYTIKSGDTLSGIAQRFNVKLADIQFSEGSDSRDQILIPGKKLTIQIQAGDENS